MVLENEIKTLERQLDDLTSFGQIMNPREVGCILALKKIKVAIETLGDLCVDYCECCDSFYDNSEVAFCEECCVGCQGKEYDDIDYYCNDCRTEINAEIDERNAIMRGDYI